MISVCTRDFLASILSCYMTELANINNIQQICIFHQHLASFISPPTQGLGKRKHNHHGAAAVVADAEIVLAPGGRSRSTFRARMTPSCTPSHRPSAFSYCKAVQTTQIPKYHLQPTPHNSPTPLTNVKPFVSGSSPF